MRGPDKIGAASNLKVKYGVVRGSLERIIY